MGLAATEPRSCASAEGSRDALGGRYHPTTKHLNLKRFAVDK